MEQINFKPWKGDNWETKPLFSKRILILGESHYEGNPTEKLNENRTIDMLNDYLEKYDHSDKRRNQFYTRIETVFLNQKPEDRSAEDRNNFWHSVMFDNFIRYKVGNKWQQRPTKEMWELSNPHFFEILQEYKPGCIICLGKGLWDHLPAATPGRTIDGPKQNQTRYYDIGDGEQALAYGIWHPSSFGFNWRNWHLAVKKAINMA